jgi:hypothetical protein
MIKIEGLKATINALKALEKDVNKKKEIEKDIRSASKSMVLAAKALAPVAEHTVKRYNNGKVVASYLPGNLKAKNLEC